MNNNYKFHDIKTLSSINKDYFYPFIIKILLLLIISTFFSCGGSNNNGVDKLKGNWTGSMSQASSIYCANGDVLGVGFGSFIKNISFQIKGGDYIGLPIEVNLENCRYIGSRDSLTEFVLTSGDKNCYKYIEFSRMNGDSGYLFLKSKKPEDKTGQDCVIDMQGEVFRG